MLDYRLILIDQTGEQPNESLLTFKGARVKYAV